VPHGAAGDRHSIADSREDGHPNADPDANVLRSRLGLGILIGLGLRLGLHLGLHLGLALGVGVGGGIGLGQFVRSLLRIGECERLGERGLGLRVRLSDRFGHREHLGQRLGQRVCSLLRIFLRIGQCQRRHGLSAFQRIGLRVRIGIRLGLSFHGPCDPAADRARRPLDFTPVHAARTLPGIALLALLVLAALAPAQADIQIVVSGPDPSPQPAARRARHAAHAKPAPRRTAGPPALAEPEMIVPSNQALRVYSRPAPVAVAAPLSPAPRRAVSYAVAAGGVRSQFVQNALRYVGVPYVWGGASPGGFDCSGFVQYTLATVGIRVPRTADDQFHALPPTDNPQPGDLVFFQTYLPGPSHVGIYLGNGYFVNSIGSDVQISSFASSYFAARYLGARRVFFE
jgi:cell wall-associated NlpC family hydrolase